MVPAYNESATISTDGTAVRAWAAGARVVRAPFNLGIGGAVQTGFVYAQEHGRRFMVQVDADGQHDPREIGTIRAEHGHSIPARRPTHPRERRVVRSRMRQ